MNSGIGQLSIKSRLTLMLVVVTLLSSFVIGLLGWRTGQNALEKSITNNISSIQSAQKFQIENHFDQIKRQTRTLAEDRMIVNAMKQFREGFNIGLYRTIDDEHDKAVSSFYEENFVPRLSKSTDDAQFSILYRPRRTITSYFQYHYLVSNPYPVGQKDGLIESELDTTIYNRFHKFYHPLFRNLTNEFGYYDIFLIDIDALNIVYSVFKETDFATSLRDGPYRETGLGVLANSIRVKPERGKAMITDFRSYTPSYGAPAAFVGSPIFDGNEAVGILAMQLPVDKINELMTIDGAWDNMGLGNSGESYLVGSDGLMRTNSRFFLEDKAQYLTRLREQGYSDETVQGIQSYDTTILMQPVTSSSVTKALDDKAGTQISTNYLGQSVLSAYGPLKVSGLDWAIVSEITEEEVFSPIAQLQRNILIWGVVLVLAVAFLAMVLSRHFVRPIEKLTSGVKALSGNESADPIKLDTQDEFGELARQYNTMVEKIRSQSSIIERSQDENDRLLKNIVPDAIALRMRDGETIADQLHQVSIAFLYLDGFSSYSKTVDTDESVAMLARIGDGLSDIAQNYDVEIVKTLGDTFVATCGVTMTRLDHSRRIVDFIIAARRTVQTLNNEYRCQLRLQAGLDAGSVMSAVVGDEKFSYELWGDTIKNAQRIHLLAKPDTVLVSDSVRDRISSLFDFKQSTTNETKDMGGSEPYQLYELKLADAQSDSQSRQYMQ